MTGKASHDTEDKPARSHTLEASSFPRLSTADNGDMDVLGVHMRQVDLTTKEAIRYVSNESKTFRTTCNKDIRVVTGGYGFVSVTCRAECLAHDGTYISFFSGFDQEEK